MRVFRRYRVYCFMDILGEYVLSMYHLTRGRFGCTFLDGDGVVMVDVGVFCRVRCINRVPSNNRKVFRPTRVVHPDGFFRTRHGGGPVTKHYPTENRRLRSPRSCNCCCRLELLCRKSRQLELTPKIREGRCGTKFGFYHLWILTPIKNYEEFLFLQIFFLQQHPRTS